MNSQVIELKANRKQTQWEAGRTARTWDQKINKNSAPTTRPLCLNSLEYGIDFKKYLDQS